MRVNHITNYYRSHFKMRRLLATLPWFAILGIGLFALILSLFAAELLTQKREEDLRGWFGAHAGELALAINPERMRHLSFTEADLVLPEFKRIRGQLRDYATAYALRGVFTVALRHGQFVFGPESYAEDDPLATQPGTPYRQPPEALWDVFERHQTVVIGPYNDEFGSFVTASAPVRDPHTGQVIAAVCLDIVADEWARSLNTAHIPPLAVTALLAVTIIAGALAMRWRDRGDEARQHRHRHIETALVAAFCLGLTFVIFWLYFDAEKRERRRVFDQQATLRTETVRRELAMIRRNLETTACFFEASDNVTADEYARFVGPMARDLAGQSFFWAPCVQPADTGVRVEEFCTDVSWELGVRVFGNNEDAPPARKERYPVCYVEPHNAVMPGMDLATFPGAGPALDEAAAYRMLTATVPAPVHGESLESLVYLPVFTPSGRISSHNTSPQGMVATRINFQRLLERSLGDGLVAGAQTGTIHVFDLSSGQLLASRFCGDECGGSRMPRYDPFDLNTLRMFKPLFAFGRCYAVEMDATPSFFAAYPLRASWIALLLGLSITVMLTLFVGFLRNLQDYLEQQVRLRTAEARASETRFRLLVEYSLDVLVFVDESGFQRYVSPSVEHITGYTAEELTRPFAEVIHPDDAQEVLDAFADLMMHPGRVIRGEYRHIHKNGGYIDVEAIGRNYLDNPDVRGIVSSVRDITERKRSEKALIESEARNQALLQALPDLLFVFHRNGVLLDYHAPEAEALLLPPETFLNKPVQESLPASLAQLTMEKLATLFNTDTVQVYEYALELQGDTRAYEARLARIDEERAVSIVRDITSNKRAEEEQRQFDEQLRQTQKLESLGVPAGGIAHDFNNILMAVMGHAELALDALPPLSPARANLGEIETAARRAAELCRQMLAYTGKATFALEPVDVSELIQEMAHLLETSISKRALLQREFAVGLSPILADPSQIRQIVMNLIINASEAIGDRDGVIHIATGCELCAEADLRAGYLLAEELMPGRYITLEVRDSGCGMDEETLRRLFEPFFSTKFTGRGLGMAATLGIVRAHKGAIQVSSKPGRGTTFRLLFPVLEQREGASMRKTDSETPWSGSGAVLIADDEESVRTVGARILERLGFQAITASDGAEAVELYREHGDEIQLVLLDLTMPRMNGEEAFDVLREINPQVKVVIASGYSEQDVVIRFAGKGLSAVVQKPYHIATLRDTLKRLLNRDAK